MWDRRFVDVNKWKWEKRERKIRCRSGEGGTTKLCAPSLPTLRSPSLRLAGTRCKGQMSIVRKTRRLKQRSKHTSEILRDELCFKIPVYFSLRDFICGWNQQTPLEKKAGFTVFLSSLSSACDPAVAWRKAIPVSCVSWRPQAPPTLHSPGAPGRTTSSRSLRESYAGTWQPQRSPGV